MIGSGLMHVGNATTTHRMPAGSFTQDGDATGSHGGQFLV